MNKFGFNIQVPGAGLDLIERYKPVAALLMDVKSEHVIKAREVSPDTEIIFRKEDGRKWRDKDPVKWAKAMWADVHKCPPDFVVADNEPLGHDHAAEFAALDNWQYDFAGWIHDNTPMCVGLFSFPEGNFTKDGPVIPDHFPRSMRAADAVFIHEYWKPHLLSPGMEGYHCLRWDAWLKWFEDAGYHDMPIYVTECGITMAVGGGPDVGYASEEAKVAGVTTETYLADLEEYHRRCCLEPRVKAVLPFIWEPYPGEWGTFVPTPEMTQRLFLFDAPGPTPEPEPPPEEDTMIKVYDFIHGMGDPTYYEGLDWLRSVFGNVVIHQPEGLQQGDPYWKIVWLDCTVGPTSCIIHTDDENGNPLEGILTVFYWSSAELFVDQGLALLPHGWTDRGAVGPTNVNGDCGPSYGPGAYYSPDRGEEGPHSVWIYDADRPAQYITCLGMLTAHPGVEGNHLKFNIGYQRAIYGGEEPPMPGPDPVGDIVAHAEAIINLTKSISVGVPTELDFVYPNGSEARYKLVPASTSALAKAWARLVPASMSVLTRVWTRIQGLIGR